VATRNFEVDSGAYFMSLLWNYYSTPGLYAPERLLNETAIHDAVLAMISTWRIEQHHEEQSPYRWAPARNQLLCALAGFSQCVLRWWQ
jgi:meiotically up-regulated gene 157 (Mug157) protein